MLALKTMIQLEKYFWEGIEPSSLFLIGRNSPLKDGIALSRWYRLKKEYEILKEEEERKYPIFEVINDNTIEQAVRQVLRSILEIIGYADSS